MTHPEQPAATTSSVLRSLLRTAGRGLAVATAAGVGFQLGIIGLPLVIQRAIDDGIVPADQGATLTWALIALALSVVVFAADLLMGWASTLAGNRAGNVLHTGLVAHVLRLDRPALRPFGPGDLAMRGTRDIDLLREWLVGIPSLVTGIGGFVLLVVAIGNLSPLLLVVVAVALPLVVAVNAYFPRRFAPANDELSAAHDARADAVEDLLTAGVAVRGIGAEQVLVERHGPRSDAVAGSTLRVGRISASWSALAPAVPQLGIGAGLAIGGAAALAGTITVGELTAFVTWMTLITTWVSVIELRLSELAAGWTAAGRIAEVLAARPAVGAPADPVELPGRGALAAVGVEVRAPGRGRIATTDLRVEPGELVAIAGPVGSGKSTLLRLLARLEDPDAGAVTYGGIDLRSAEPAVVRKRITLVGQRPVAVSGTIASNLRLGRPGASAAMLRDACRVAAFDEQVEALPAGYETAVGEGGSTLSGGQRQRLALAGAVLAGADVVLLDDPTSAVDEETEALIVERLRAWLAGAGPASLPPPGAVVAVSHRRAVLAAADRVVTLADPARSGAEPGLVASDHG